MYEGIEDIIRLLDANRLKEALTQLQAISTQANRWDLHNRIENTLMAYGYMLQYAGQGADDPNRKEFYRQTLRTAYELTDVANIALMAPKAGATFYERIRTSAIQPTKAYSEIQMQLEAYTEDMAKATLLYTGKERLQTETDKLWNTHETALNELFDKTWATPLWTETESKEANDILQSVWVNANDIAIMVSAATLSLLRIFDARKFCFLLDAYRHENPEVAQRALVGMVIALYKHGKRIPLYPEILSRLSLLGEEESFRKDLQTIQMQLLFTRETSKIDKKMREEIIPEMIKNAKQLNNPKFKFDDTEDAEDRNPEWQDWMDKSGLTDKIKEMDEWQTAGGDIYMSSFAQLKVYPFFNRISHWFYPFDINLPELAPVRKDLEGEHFSILKMITLSDNFCNSDKYSFVLALMGMPPSMKEMSLQQMEGQMEMQERMKDKMQTLTRQGKEPKTVSKLYIQDLYRFFKLWKRHQEEEDIFKWKFNLWDSPFLGDALQQEDFVKELADYLLQKEYMEEAYTLYRKLMDNHSQVAEVYQKAGYIMQKQKNYKEAFRHYEHADILLPDNVWTNKHLAQCYKLSGNIPMALKYYRKVESVQPDNLNIALQIGQCYARTEQYGEALAYFYKVEYLEKNPDNARRAIAWCSFVTGKEEEALKYYGLLLEQPSPKAEDWMNAGHVHLVSGHMQEALHHYRNAQKHYEYHGEFVEAFQKDKDTLLHMGLSEEDMAIVLDLLI